MIRRVKGTQDFLDLRLFNFVLDTISQHLTRYHFTQIETPIIEHTELFKRSLGQQTDVVSKEMFTIEMRAEDDEGICLRPEATASIARAFVENGVQTTPWKVWTWGPMFRYERPQKGRYRQFHQISMEVIGSQSVAQDVHCIKMLDRYFHEVLHLNNYALLINFLGCADDRVKLKKKLAAFLEKNSAIICATCTERKDKNIMRIFDCKNPDCQKLYEQAPVITEYLCEACAQEWTSVQTNLHFLSVSYVHKPTLVRGLDYYNKTVFEFVSNDLGAQNTFCGGGRYDHLVKDLGASQDQPSIGAAIGLERLILMLDLYKDRIALPQLPALHVIIPMASEQQALSLILADVLQAEDLCVEVLLEGDSVKSMMRKANKLGAAYCLILGSDEQATKTVTVKNMITGEEHRMPQVDVVKFLKQR
jgi:histidyl-tRNA synthetase